MALKRRKVKQSGGTPAKKKATFKKAEKPVEVDPADSDDGFDDDDENGFDNDNNGFDELGDGFDDMEEIPLETTQAVSIPKTKTKSAVKKTIKENVEKSDSKESSAKSKQRKDHLKPPTSQELNALRETENLFHSNIFKLQVEELLTEISLKSKRKKEIEGWISQLKETIETIPESSKHPITETAWLDKLKVKCPFESDCYNAVQTFQYLKPQKVTSVGSWAVGLAVKSSVVDVLIEIPRDCLERDDHLSYRYHRKRALYLAYVAAHLQKTPGLVEEIKFDAPSGDLSRPILVVQPSGKLNQRVSFRIFASTSADFVAVEKLLPDRNCIPGNKKTDSNPTPLYNVSILADMRMAKTNQYATEVLSTKKNILDALLLLRTWLKHRQLDEAFGMFVLTQFVVHLVDTKKLFPNMSVYQVIRTVWLQLSRSDWSREGITLRQQSGTPPLSVADAHASFPVVFLDATSTLNLCAHVSKATYQWMRWECSLAVGLLNKKAINSFAALFITPKPFLLSYDNVVIFDDVRSKLLKDRRQLYWPVEAAEKIHQCLAKGLGERLKLAACKRTPIDSWPVNVIPPKDDWKLTFGFCFNSPAAWEIINKGPAADSPESAEFRAFWGEKSELRRFQDGFICEAVTWPAKNWSERRLICRQIVSYLAEKRLNLKKLVYIADQLDPVLSIPKLEDPTLYGTGEEATMSALEALDDLTKNLRALEDLPLPIAQVQGVAATFRHAETFPPVPQIPQGKVKLFGRSQDNLLPSVEATPIYLPVLPVLLSLQTSGKWPDDLEAVRRIKAAFYIQLADKLQTLFDMVVRVFVDHAIVEYKGYIFKLVIAYHRDVALLKRIVEPNGIVKYRDNPASLLLQRDQEITPLLTSALRALQAVQPAFSVTVRLAKRWIASQMLFEYLEEEAVEMIVASLFIDSTMYGVPSSSEEEGAQTSLHDAIDWEGPLTPQVAFLRFLQLVASYEWNSQPLVINFNSDLSPEELRDIETAISAQRTQLKSPLVLVTPYDPSGVAFTRSKPPLPAWSRLMELARESLKLLERQLMEADTQTMVDVDVCQVFRPPMDVYDCVIHLTRGAVARRLYTLDCPSDWKVKLHQHQARKTLPIYDYEPVDRLLRELRAAYADKARFFYDNYGGLLIGVMWIDKAWSTPTEFKVSHVNASMLVAPSSAGAEQRLAPNLEAICQDFLILGKGLVKTVRSGTLVYGQDQV